VFIVAHADITTVRGKWSLSWQALFACFEVARGVWDCVSNTMTAGNLAVGTHHANGTDKSKGGDNKGIDKPAGKKWASLVS
jgi:hypothetical protein